MRTETWNEQVELVKNRYSNRIEKILNELKKELEEEFDYPISGPDFWDCDDYRWSLFIELDQDENKHDGIDIAFQICDSTEYDGSEDGINFSIEAVHTSGRMLGGCTPFNYSNEVWVSLNDEDGIEKRFRLMEELCPLDMVHLIGDFLERNN